MQLHIKKCKYSVAMIWLNLYTRNRILQGIILLCSDRHHAKNISLIWLKCTERQVRVMVNENYLSI